MLPMMSNFGDEMKTIIRTNCQINCQLSLWFILRDLKENHHLLLVKIAFPKLLLAIRRTREHRVRFAWPQSGRNLGYITRSSNLLPLFFNYEPLIFYSCQ